MRRPIQICSYSVDSPILGEFGNAMQKSTGIGLHMTISRFFWVSCCSAGTCAGEESPESSADCSAKETVACS
jgi:hypothetical protein